MESRVALVHDFLLDLRGAERVFAAVCDAWPQADVFSAVYDEQGTEGRFADRDVHTSFLQRLRPDARTFRVLLPLYPHAVESLDLRGYDVVVSSSSAWAHGVLVDPGAVHVCYCHNPFRYAWSEREATLRARSPLTRPALALLLHRWRQWDWIAAQRVDRYLANSALTASRVRRCLGREATVLHPPVELNRFRPGPVGEHYLVLSELMSHKRIDVAVAAFNRLRWPLVVVGDGPAARRLRRAAGPTVRFTGRLRDDEVAELLRSCRALLVPGAEEFGIAAVEALASGRPVLAADGGGVRESVQEGLTGAFFAPGDVAALVDCLRAFDPLAVDPGVCVASAQPFAPPRFQAALRGVVADTARARQQRPRPAERTAVPAGLVSLQRRRTSSRSAP